MNITRTGMAGTLIKSDEVDKLKLYLLYGFEVGSFDMINIISLYLIPKRYINIEHF